MIVPAASDPVPFDPFADALRGDPYAVYAHYRERDPVHRGVPALPGLDATWYLFRHADVAAALRDPRLVQEHRRACPRDAAAGRPAAHRAFWEHVERWMLLRDDPDHGRLRALLGRAFSPAAVAALRPDIAALADGLLDAVVQRGDADLVTSFASPLPAAVIARVLGIPLPRPETFRARSRAIAAALDMRASDAPLDEAAAAMADWIADLEVEIGRRRGAPGAGLLDALRSARDAGALEHDELLAMATLLLLVGQETTADLIGNGILALLRHPRQLELLRGDPTRLPAAVDEMLRFDTPVQTTILRTALVDLEIGGRRIARGETVAPMLGAANRDPRVFADPDRFDVTRASRSPGVVFGLGAHFCVGSALARLETEIAIACLLRRAPGVQLAGRPVRRDGVGFRGLSSLPVRS